MTTSLYIIKDDTVRLTPIEASQCCRASNSIGDASTLLILVKNRLKSSTSTSNESCARCRSSRSTRHSTSLLFSAANNHLLYVYATCHKGKVLHIGFANLTVFSKPGFSGLESSKPGLRVANDRRTGDVMGLTVVKPITRPLACLLNFVVAKLLLHVLHQQLETEHQKVTDNIRKHHQLIASCKQKRTESQSFQYHIHIVINHH